jgi:hypothetical protein
MDFEDFLFLNFFLASFRPFPRHTCGPLASHQYTAAHRLKIAIYRIGLLRMFLYLQAVALELHAVGKYVKLFTLIYSEGLYFCVKLFP